MSSRERPFAPGGFPPFAMPFPLTFRRFLPAAHCAASGRFPFAVSH